MKSNNLCEGRAVRMVVEISVLALLLGSVVGTAATFTPNTNSVGSWTFVFTYRETPLPDETINFFCNEVKSATVSWFERETSKYQVAEPFSEITCTQEQVLLSGNLLIGYQMYAEGQWITNPLNDFAVIKLLEKNNPAVSKAKYVTIFHYMPGLIPFANHAYSNKYNFIFITGSDPFYPRLTIDNYGTPLAHELMHSLGASDKYDEAQQACWTNPETGQQYSGYDIMCHRVGTAESGFVFPPFSELMVTEPTAKEINWKLPLPPPPVPEAPTIVLTGIGVFGVMFKIRRNR
jgi:hypothetical protein